MSVPPSLDSLDTPAEAAAVRRLPFAFAKRHGVLLQAGRVVYRPGAALMAVAEALRFTRLKGKDLSSSKIESINKSVLFSPHEFGGNAKVKDLEAVQDIVYKNDSGKDLPKYQRRVDIVLEGEEGQQWYEVKSLLDARYIPSNFQKGTRYHREFYADLLASYGLLEPLKVKAYWRFHAFTSQDKKTTGPSNARFNSFNPRKHLCEPMKDVSSAKTLGDIQWKESVLEAACKASQDVKLMNNRTILVDTLKSKEFTEEFKGILEDFGGLD